MKQFQPPRFHFIAKPEEVINFTFTYTGEDKILGVEAGCSGCTTLVCNGETITGTLTLDEKSKYSAAAGVDSTPVNKNIQVWFEDDEDWFVFDENLQKFPNPKKISVPLYLSGQVDLR